MTKPRTVAGQAVLSGMRPHVKRALAHTILAIEAEAVAPYVEALRELVELDDARGVAGEPGSPWALAKDKAHVLLAQATAMPEIRPAPGVRRG